MTHTFLKKSIVASLTTVVFSIAGSAAAIGQTHGDDWEWEPDEGYHQQEWYDPSDWFDDNDGIDFEDGYDDYDYDYDDDDDAWYESSPTSYRDTWSGDTSLGDYYDAYYDGYYDAFHDDEYGYDAPSSSVMSDDAYSNGYTQGYYDGMYDRTNDYDYDPYYYIYTVSETSRDKRSDRQRANDRDRQRGDRHKAMAKGDRERERRQASAAKHHREAAKLRGNVEDIEFVQGTRANDSSALIARIELEDGKSRIVNLGPKMTKGDLPFDEGDRVTICGDLTKNNGRTVLMAHAITADGDTARIASRGDAHRDRSSKSGQANARTLRGDVASIRPASFDQSDDDRWTIVRITTDDGRSSYVAFESNRFEDHDDIDIERGDTIHIRGEHRRVNGRTVFVPDNVNVNGNRMITLR